MSLELRAVPQQYAFRKLSTSLPVSIPRSNVRQLDRHETKELLRACISRPEANYAATSQLLSESNEFHPCLRSFFTEKDYNVEHLKLRLIDDPLKRQTGQDDSFIAMSYRWRDLTRASRSRDLNRAEYVLPTSDIMYQAILDERCSGSEGLWLDQVCVNQDDEIEKTTTIGMMDMIYQSARIVVIALDDVELSHQEISVLKALEDDNVLGGDVRKSPNEKVYRHARRVVGVLHAILEKIASSEYFQRAWCQHEWRMGKKHVFLARCEWDDRDDPQIIKFTGAFLLFMIGNYARNASPSISAMKLHRELLSVYSGRVSTAQGSDMEWTFKSWMPAMAEVFLNKAGGDPTLPTQELREHDANRDKISIVLNAVGCGLQLPRPTLNSSGDHGSRPFTTSEFRRQILLLALAARDPVVLCTTRRPLYLGGLRYSWLCWPYTGRIDERFFLALPPMPSGSVELDQSPICAYVDLDLTLLETSSLTGDLYRVASTGSIQRARQFLNACLNNSPEDHRSEYWRDLRQRFRYDIQRDNSVVASTLALLMSEQTDHPDQLPFLVGHDVVENLVDIAHLGRYDYKRDQHGSALGILSQLKELIPDRFLRAALQTIPAILNFGLQNRNEIGSTEGESGPATSYLVFLPDVSGIREQNRNIKLAIPSVLLSGEYGFLARCWILQRLPSSSEKPEWEMLGKTELTGYSNDLRFALLSHMSCAEKHRVFGPEATATNFVTFASDSHDEELIA